MAISDFKTLWVNWVSTAYEDALQALSILSKDYHLACLSNTNELHWAYIDNETAFLDAFEFKFASHILGLAKPDLQIYQETIKQLNTALGVAPHDILFFDDTLDNITAAQQAGLKAVHIDRNVGAAPTLKEMGLIKA